MSNSKKTGLSMLSGFVWLHAARRICTTVINGSRWASSYQSSSFVGEFPRSVGSFGRNLAASLFLVVVTLLVGPARLTAQDQSTPTPLANGQRQEPPPSAGARKAMLGLMLFRNRKMSLRPP